MKNSTLTRISVSTEQRREHIILAATSIIATEGLPALSVRNVASRAGCSRGLVEHYFRNKTALLVASNDLANQKYLRRVDAAVGELTGLKALEIRLRNLLPFDETTHDEWKVRVAFWHQGITIPLVEESNNQSFYVVYRAIETDMRRAQTDGEIASTIPLKVTAELLLFTVIGLCTSCMNDARLRQRAPLDRRMAMILGFLKTGDVGALEVGDPDTEY